MPMKHHFLKIALFIYNPFALTIFSEKNHHVGIKLEKNSNVCENYIIGLGETHLVIFFLIFK